MFIQPAISLKGEVSIPGDKSISHRSIMLGALAEGTTEVSHFLWGADCLSTIACFQKLGVDIDMDDPSEDGPAPGGRIRIHGKGLYGLREPQTVLDAGNSGTTTRLICGILAGSPFTSTITGDASIQKRPMRRIITPLLQMGASVTSMKNPAGTNSNAADAGISNAIGLNSSAGENDYVPLIIHGGQLHGIHYHTPVASAQVKSCILLAGLYADSPTSVTEPALSRNHTELMLASFGADIASCGTTATIQPQPRLHAQKIEVPGDISSAAYFIAAALLVPNSELLIRNVGMNQTRDGILRVVDAMGGNIKKLNIHEISGETVCDLLVTSSELTGTTIGGSLIPTLIDEIPVLAVLAAYADGTTIIRDAAELKVKESDRIASIVHNLKAMGADIEATKDGMVIHGGKPLHYGVIDTCADHRIAMAFAVAALRAEGGAELMGADCVTISYPQFYQDFDALCIRK